MERSFDPEAIDLASLRAQLEQRCGAFVEGEVVGRTLLRDEVARHLDCSALEAERVVDTMVGRGFLRRLTLPNGMSGWSTAAP